MDVSMEQAVAACEQVRSVNHRRFFSLSRWQCWGCMRFGGDDPARRCMHTDAGGWDACPHVNRVLKAQH